MKRSVRICGAMAAMTGALALTACKVERDEPTPEPSPTDAPRSIFQDDPAQANDTVLPPETLPPLETTLSFADGTSEITEAVRAELATVTGSPQVEAGGSIVLRGHSASASEGENPLEASQARAEAVRDFLIDAGLAEERIAIIAFGSQNPVEPNALPDGTPNADGRAANNRVELTVETGQSSEREQTLIETLTTPEETAPQRPKPSPSAKQTPRTQ